MNEAISNNVQYYYGAVLPSSADLKTSTYCLL